MFSISKTLASAALLFWLIQPNLLAQIPFESKGQVFLALYNDPEIVEINNEQNAGNIVFTTVADQLPEPFNALAYRSSDRHLYAIGLNTQTLYRIDATGNVSTVGSPDLNESLDYVAGDISPDGSSLWAVGTNPGGNDVHLASIDLNSADLTIQTYPIGTASQLLDIAFHPTSGQLYGFDALGKRAVYFSPFAPVFTELEPFADINNGVGVFFDAFGDLFAYGTTGFGAVDALLDLDEDTGNETVHGSTSLHPVADVASCHTSLEINLRPDPAMTLPCAEVEFIYTIANNSGQLVSDVNLAHTLPEEFTFLQVTNNPFGGTLSTVGTTGIMLEGMSIPTGIQSLKILAEIGDEPAGDYASQALLSNLPDFLGNECVSDDPASARWDDASTLTLNVIEVDSLNYSSFLCLGNVYTLDAGQFGNNVQWFNGSTNPLLEVTNSGVYPLTVSSGCQDIDVTYEVTAATCPYTIELTSEPVPSYSYQCSEIIWHYTIENDTGEEREGASLTDTLPQGCSFLEILENPFGGTLTTDLPGQNIRIEEMHMPLGVHTLQILVEVGDVLPGDYQTRATLSSLPPLLGESRLSDDPNTNPFDSTQFTVLGTIGDSVRLDTHLCPGRTLTLNAAKLGQSFLWENGETDSIFTVSTPGVVKLEVFGGCDPSIVEYDVKPAPGISVAISPDETEINLGSEVTLLSQIFNEDDSLYFYWHDPLGYSLDCTNCPNPVASPLETTTYLMAVGNRFCQDTALATVRVDDSRRIYAPTAFSPNGDGINDYFFLQSPDPGTIRQLTIVDRWGSQVFESSECVFNQETTGWDGRHRGQQANMDTYTWWAQIEFIDGKVEDFFGNMIIVR